MRLRIRCPPTTTRSTARCSCTIWRSRTASSCCVGWPQATRHAVLVDDLVRSRLGFALVLAGSYLLTRSPVVHTDGPLSVRAALSLERGPRTGRASRAAWSDDSPALAGTILALLEEAMSGIATPQLKRNRRHGLGRGRDRRRAGRGAGGSSIGPRADCGRCWSTPSDSRGPRSAAAASIAAASQHLRRPGLRTCSTAAQPLRCARCAGLSAGKRRGSLCPTCVSSIALVVRRGAGRRSDSRGCRLSCDGTLASVEPKLCGRLPMDRGGHATLSGQRFAARVVICADGLSRSSVKRLPEFRSLVQRRSLADRSRGHDAIPTRRYARG